jgi:hypothetical protein
MQRRVLYFSYHCNPRNEVLLYSFVSFLTGFNFYRTIFLICRNSIVTFKLTESLFYSVTHRIHDHTHVQYMYL